MDVFVALIGKTRHRIGRSQQTLETLDAFLKFFLQEEADVSLRRRELTMPWVIKISRAFNESKILSFISNWLRKRNRKSAS